VSGRKQTWRGRVHVARGIAPSFYGTGIVVDAHHKTVTVDAFVGEGRPVELRMDFDDFEIIAERVVAARKAAAEEAERLRFLSAVRDGRVRVALPHALRSRARAIVPEVAS
jgi:hypothetical protein